MTIFALSSGSGRAGIAVIRVSGPAAGGALRALSGMPANPPARHAARVRLRGAGGETIDEALALWFPAPASFTGEDVAELHVHGGGAVVARVLEELSALPGLRPAGAGEFTRRAFANGKLDLTQVEGLADLIEAETEAQRRQAQRALDGEVGRLYIAWSERLKTILAHVESAIDFPEDVEADEVMSAMQNIISRLSGEIEEHMAGYNAAELVRGGVHIAIVGAPNVGKSSLLNRLAGRDAAIVSQQPGTTRDVVEVAWNLGGFRIWLADTAGLREASGEVEREGVRRARARAAAADLVIAVVDAQAGVAESTMPLEFLGSRSLVVVNKMDLVAELPAGFASCGTPLYEVSARTGRGFAGLRRALYERVAELSGVAGAPIIRERYRDGLVQCVEALGRATRVEGQELQAEDLRLALRSLGRITGRVDVEDLLDVIFRDFCIGK